MNTVIVFRNDKLFKIKLHSQTRWFKKNSYTHYLQWHNRKKTLQGGS